MFIPIVFPERPSTQTTSGRGTRGETCLRTPSLAGRPGQFPTAAARPHRSHGPAVAARHLGGLRSEGALPPRGATFRAPCRGAATLPWFPAPHHEEALRKHPAPGRPACIRPAPPAPFLTPSHTPDPPAPRPGQRLTRPLQAGGSSGQRRAAPPQTARRRGR